MALLTGAAGNTETSDEDAINQCSIVRSKTVFVGGDKD